MTTTTTTPTTTPTEPTTTPAQARTLEKTVGGRKVTLTAEQAEAFADACRAHGFVDVRVEEHHMDRHDVLAVLATAAVTRAE